MMAPHVIVDFPAGTGAASTSDAARRRRNHAGSLLPLVLLVPLTAVAITPERQFKEELAQQLSRRLPGLTADEIALPVQPSCRADQLQIAAIRGNAFGTSSLILRCSGSDALPFTATLRTRLRKPESAHVKAQTMRRGRKVRLEIVTRGLSINTTASTLAAGDVGETIAVRAARTNRVLQAQVIDASTVRAVLEERR